MRIQNFSVSLLSVLMAFLASPYNFAVAQGRGDSDFRQDVRQLQELEISYKDAASSIQRVINQLENKNQNYLEAQQKLSDLSNEQDRKQDRIKNNQKDVRELRRDNTELSRQKDQMDQKLAELTEPYQKIQREVRIEEKNVAPIKTAYDNADKAYKAEEKQNNALNVQKTSLSTTLSSSEQTVASKNKSITSNLDDITKNENSIKAINEGAAKSKTSLEELEKTEAVDKSRKADIEKEIRSMNQRDPKNREKLASLRKELLEIENRLKANAPLKKRYQSVVDRADASIKPLERQIQSKKLENTRFEKDIEIAQKSADDAKVKLEALKPKIKKSDTDLAALKITYDDKKSSYDKASVKLNRLKEQEDAHYQRITKQTEKINEVQSKISFNDSQMETKSKEIERLQKQTQDLAESINELSRKVNRISNEITNLESERNQYLNVLDRSYFMTNSSNVLHILAGASDSISSSAYEQLTYAKRLGKKVIIWFAARPSNQLLYNLQDLTGVSNTRDDYGYNLSGVGVLEGVQIQADRERISLSIDSYSNPLMLSDNNLVFINSKLITQGSMLQSVVVSSGISPSEVGEAKLAQMIRKIHNASLQDFLPIVEPEPVPVPPQPRPEPPYPRPDPQPQPQPQPQPGYVYTVDLPNINLAIPDNDQNGVSQELYVKGNSYDIVSDLELEVYIKHGYVGDLQVKLVHPSGEEIVLHQNQGGRTLVLDLHLYGDTLKQFVGLKAAGSWILQVKDSAAADTGFIESVKLKVQMN